MHLSLSLNYFLLSVVLGMGEEVMDSNRCQLYYETQDPSASRPPTLTSLRLLKGLDLVWCGTVRQRSSCFADHISNSPRSALVTQFDVGDKVVSLKLSVVRLYY